MANYTSQLIRRQQPQKPLNTEAIGFVLQSKEQKWNANQAKIDEKLAQLGTIDLAREEDKEYLLGNVKGLLNSVSNVSQLDYSSDSVSRGLDNAITGATDDYIIDQVVNTKKIRRFGAQVQQMKEKNPELYSDANYAHSLYKSGYQDYMSKKSDTIVGNMEYTPYTDVSEELDNIVKNIDKFADVVKEARPDGNGYIVKKDGKILTPEKLRVLAENSLSQNARGQMEINGWYNYDRGQASFEDINTQFQQFSQEQNKDIDSQINSLQVKLKNTNSIQTKQDINHNIKALQEYKTNLNDEYSKWEKNGAKDKMTSTMEKETYLDRFSKTFAIDNVNITYEEDKAYSERQEMQYKYNIAMLKGTRKDSNKNGITDAQQVSIPQVGLEETIKPIDSLRGSIENTKNSLTQNAEAVFNTLPVEVQNDINAKVGDRDRGEYIAEYLDDKVLESSNIVSIGTVKQLQDLKNRKTSLQDRYNRAAEEATVETEAEIFTNIFDVVQENPNIKIATENGKQSFKQYLDSKGITSYEQLKNNEKEFGNFKKQAYADYLLSTNDLSEFNIRRLARLFGEGTEEIPTETSDVTYTSVGGPLIAAGGVTKLSNNPSSMKKTIAFLNDVKSKGAYDTSFSFTDDSFQDDRTSNRLLRPQEIQDKINSKLGDTTNDLSRDVAIRVEPETDLHESLMSVVADATSGGGVFLGKEKVPMSILPDTDPAYVNIVQTQVIGSGKEKTTGPVVKRELISNLPQNIREEINFSNTKQLFTKENAPKIERKVIFGEESDYRRVRDITKNVTGSEDIAYLTTKERAIESLKNSYPSLFQEGEGYDQLLETVVQDDNFRVVMENIDGDTYTSIKYSKNGVNENIYTFTEFVEEEDFDTAYNNVKFIPQLYVQRMLDAALSKSVTAPQSPNTILQNILKVYNGN